MQLKCFNPLMQQQVGNVKNLLKSYSFFIHLQLHSMVWNVWKKKSLPYSSYTDSFAHQPVLYLSLAVNEKNVMKLQTSKDFPML